jgi:hypothetical protein
MVVVLVVQVVPAMETQQVAVAVLADMLVQVAVVVVLQVVYGYRAQVAQPLVALMVVTTVQMVPHNQAAAQDYLDKQSVALLQVAVAPMETMDQQT